MGTWDVGPFNNDSAADFCWELDEAAAGEREGIVRRALIRVIDTADYLEAPESEEAVAAAALVAAQCPEGEPADPVYGTKEPLPDLTGLRHLALQAIDRVMTAPSELMDLWDESDGSAWRANMHRFHAALLPQPSTQQLRVI